MATKSQPPPKGGGQPKRVSKKVEDAEGCCPRTSHRVKTKGNDMLLFEVARREGARVGPALPCVLPGRGTGPNPLYPPP